MSSPIEGLQDKYYLDSLLQSDHELAVAFSFLMQNDPTSPSSSPKNSYLAKEEALEKIAHCVIALFKVIQHEAAVGNFSYQLQKNHDTDVEEYFKLHDFKSCLLDTTPLFHIILKLFRQTLSITIEIKPGEWILSWTADHPFLPVNRPDPPQSIPQIHRSQKAYFTSLFENPKDSADITFQIEERMIQAHTLFLKQSHFFGNFFQFGGKEKSTGIYLIEGFSYAVFKAMLQFFYLYEIEEHLTQDAKFMVDLYKLGNYILFEPLQAYCRVHLERLINETNFLMIAFVQEAYKDEFLGRLCRWFIAKHFDYGHDLKISHFSLHQLIETYRMAKKYHAEGLKSRSAKSLIKRLELKESIPQLVKLFDQLNDHELRDWLEAHIQLTLATLPPNSPPKRMIALQK